MADLRSVLAERDFRRLFSVRLISQAGDGIVTAGVGTYVFFNASSFPSPSAAAAAFTVLYLPYSVIGPFAGVLIDRWSRRQILVFSALLRSAFVVLTAAVMASGDRGVAGPVISASSYFMKSPPEQYGDDVCRDLVEKFIRGEVAR